MLDTNILSYLVRDTQGMVRNRLAEVGPETVSTSIVAACKLQFGANKRWSEKLFRSVEAVLSAIPILPLEPGVEKVYAKIRNLLETTGRMIGPNDLLIAAHALDLGVVVVTATADEFQHVPALPLENWLVDS